MMLLKVTLNEGSSFILSDVYDNPNIVEIMLLDEFNLIASHNQ